jgi:hypothetical protein
MAPRARLLDGREHSDLPALKLSLATVAKGSNPAIRVVLSAIRLWVGITGCRRANPNAAGGPIQCWRLPDTVRVIPWICTGTYRYRVPVEYAKLETACLAHVEDSYYFGAHCRKCGHHARLSLAKLRARLGDDFPVRKVRDKLRCERCADRRQIVITFLSPDQRTGSLTHLFERKPHQ